MSNDETRRTTSTVHDPLEFILARVVRFFGGEASAVSYTVLGFLFVLLKVLVASRFDTTTAAALLGASGIAAVVTGAVALSMPFMSGLLFFLAFASYTTSTTAQWSPTWEATLRVLAVIVRVIAVVLAVTAVPALMVVVILAVLWAIRGRGLPLSSVVACGVVTVALLTLVPDRLWVPAENVTLTAETDACQPRSAANVCTAYVVHSDDVWTTLLHSSQRQIARVRQEAVAAREVCRLDPVYLRSLYMLGHPLLPEAPRWWAPDCLSPDSADT